MWLLWYSICTAELLNHTWLHYKFELTLQSDWFTLFHLGLLKRISCLSVTIVTGKQNAFWTIPCGQPMGDGQQRGRHNMENPITYKTVTEIWVEGKQSILEDSKWHKRVTGVIWMGTSGFLKSFYLKFKWYDILYNTENTYHPGHVCNKLSTPFAHDWQLTLVINTFSSPTL